MTRHDRRPGERGHGDRGRRGGDAGDVSALGLPWRVASNSSHEEMRAKFACLGITDLVAGRVHSHRDVPRGKPAPDLFLATAAAGGVPPRGLRRDRGQHARRPRRRRRRHGLPRLRAAFRRRASFAPWGRCRSGRCASCRTCSRPGCGRRHDAHVPGAVYLLWTKSFHVISVIAWLAGLFYLPRLFVYHCEAVPGSLESERFKVMERRLLKQIMSPAMIAAWTFGILLVLTPGAVDWHAGWWHVKLTSVVLMTGVQGVLSKRRQDFLNDRNVKPQRLLPHPERGPDDTDGRDRHHGHRAAVLNAARAAGRGHGISASAALQVWPASLANKYGPATTATCRLSINRENTRRPWVALLTRRDRLPTLPASGMVPLRRVPGFRYTSPPPPSGQPATPRPWQGLSSGDRMPVAASSSGSHRSVVPFP